MREWRMTCLIILDEFLDFVFEVMAAAVSDPFLSLNFDISFTDI